MTKEKVAIHTNNFEDLYKRLLLQPITFKVIRTDTGCEVEITSKEGVTHLINHLSNFIHEKITSKAINDVFTEQGAYPDWAKTRLTPKLSLDKMESPWKERIKEYFKKYVNDAIEQNKPLKLDAYMTFATSDVQAMATVFGEELEDITFFGVIERTVSALEIDDFPSHSVPSEISIELQGISTEMKFLTEPNEEGIQSEVVNTDDFVRGVANLYAESVYFPDSKRYKEAQFYTYTLLMMKRWSVTKWLVPTEVYGPLERYRSRLDIPSIIEEKSQTD